MAERLADILLVEDNLADVELTRIAFREAEVRNPLHAVRDGIEALAFLRKQPPYQDAPRPALILLDLNMPGKNGCQVLAEIRADADLRRIPVCMLSVSCAEADVLRSYDLGANSYISKPVTLPDFIEVVAEIDAYWLKTVELPAH
jgi:CheY-like chemotaxis protein